MASAAAASAPGGTALAVSDVTSDCVGLEVFSATCAAVSRVSSANGWGTICMVASSSSDIILTVASGSKSTSVSLDELEAVPEGVTWVDV